MKRLFVLLLICLLPLQVFAGMLTYRDALHAASPQTHAGNLLLGADTASPDRASVQSPLVLPDTMAANITGAVDNGSGDEDSDNAIDLEDFASHAGIGDEPALQSTYLFVSDMTRLAPRLSSDAASQPPFLPPAGRPPRV